MLIKKGVTNVECSNCNYIAYADALKKLCYDRELRITVGIVARERKLNIFSSGNFGNNVIKLINL